MADTSLTNWAEKRLPKLLKLTHKTDESKALRKKMFEEFDNGNGVISLAEVDKAIRDVLQIDELFDAKPAIMRAFQTAKDSQESSRGEVGDDYIELREFKYFLVSLLEYFRYYLRFTKVDKNCDKRISLIEFKEATGGIDAIDAEEGFKKMDKNGGGFVLFDEWCVYNISEKDKFEFLDD